MLADSSVARARRPVLYRRSCNCVYTPGQIKDCVRGCVHVHDCVYDGGGICVCVCLCVAMGAHSATVETWPRASIAHEGW